MARSLRLLVAVVALASSDVVYGGYDNTEWGMSLARVKALQPGGVAIAREGVINYRFVRKVAGRPAMLDFEFESDKLTLVTVVFFKPGSKVNLRRGHYGRHETRDAKATWKSLRAGLCSKYGEPIVDDMSIGNEEGVFTVWATDKQDHVGLFRRDEPVINRSDLGLQYRPALDESEPAVSPNVDGL